MADILKVGDILEVRVVCNFGTQYAINVRHLKATVVPGGNTDFTTVALALTAKLGPAYKAVLSDTAKYYGLGVRRLSPNPTLETITYSPGGPGSIVGDIMSTQTAGVISLRTDLPGRSNRGRIYVPFPAKVDSTSAGKPTQAYLNGLQAIASLFITATTWNNGATNFTTTGVLWHRRTRTASDLTTNTNRDQWGTQRRRSQINRPDREPF